MNKQVLTSIISILAAAGLLGTTIFMSLPSNVVYSRDGNDGVRSLFNTVMPQSWPFFTKPPSEPELNAYEISDGLIRSVSKFPNNRPSNLYGLSREQRAQGPEMANILFPVPDSEWIECEDYPESDCLVETAETEPFEIDNRDYPHQSLCGDIILAETEPVDFVHRDSFNGWRQEIRAVNLRIDC